MNQRIRIATWGLALGGLMGLPACVVVAAGAGAAGAAYVMGHLDGPMPGTPQKVVQASEAVLKEQEMHILSSDATGVDGKVVARSALDTRIEITVKRQDDSTSQISIRVGTFGDQKLSRELYDKIKAKL
jgi:hypothetical protein